MKRINHEIALLALEEGTGGVKPPRSETPIPLDSRVNYNLVARRMSWLVGLLLFQSTSSFILKSFDALLEKHPVIIYFLTMLVGAGGNAGNQSAMLIVRSLALGELNKINIKFVLLRELKVSVIITAAIVVVGFLRVYIFQGTLTNALAIMLSLLVIVLVSIIIGTLLPIALWMVNIDPAHSGPTIQVIMDILGVLITCSISSLLLDT
eukprot:GILJ01007593.1.p1 GENE.GILJ01007593.1~~GILJ01007593.1.p1  ORF type:complete len:208 (+),score=18.00 GILJ01007593.1:162-785(+)